MEDEIYHTIGTLKKNYFVIKYWRHFSDNDRRNGVSRTGITLASLTRTITS